VSKFFWEKWFWTEWLGDPAVGATTLAGRGLEAEALNVMMANSTYSVGGSLPQLARVFRCDVAELVVAINALIESKALDVHLHDVDGKTMSRSVTLQCHAVVTLVSRRRYRAHKLREEARLRQEKHRQRIGVTTLSPENKSPPSNSNSNSNSSGSSGRGKGGGVFSEDPPTGPPSVDAEIPTLAQCQEYATNPACAFPPRLVAEWYDRCNDRGWGKDWRARMRSAAPTYRTMWSERKLKKRKYNIDPHRETAVYDLDKRSTPPQSDGQIGAPSLELKRTLAALVKSKTVK
jgi:hypothetical protein